MAGRWVGFCRNVWLDVRYALRGLKNAPGYAVTMIVTLALGLGAVTAMLAVVDSVLLRAVALPHPEQLVMISGKHEGDSSTFMLSHKQIEAMGREARLFTAVSGYRAMPKPIEADDGVRMALLTEVTPNFFHMLGVPAKYGRLMRESDAAAPVAVVNAAFVHERLHGDSKGVGATIKISGRSRTVIGILPDGVHFPQGVEAPIVYTPLALSGGAKDELFGNTASVMARMKPGVSPEQAEAELRNIFAHDAGLKDANPVLPVVSSYADYLTGNMRTGLLALLGGCGVLLLIACANAANLQIVRATGRVSEMDVRSALGATLRRLLQQVMTESLVVSLIGASLGGLIAYGLVAVVRKAYAGQYARFEELSLHPLIFGACVLLAAGAGVLAALAPVLRIRSSMRPATMTTARTTRRSHAGGLLVVVQIALTCVLLVVSGLFFRTFRALEDVPLGFDPHGVTTVVLMPQNPHQDPAVLKQTVTQLLDAFGTLPGVQAAMTQTSIPFSSFSFTMNGETDVSGRTFHDGDSAFYSMVSSNFVQASGVRLLRGRAFLPQDDGSAAMVALVNHAFVQKFLAGRDPIGVNLKAHRGAHETDADLPFPQAMTVVGVVENELQGGDLGAPFQPMVYLDYRQLPEGAVPNQIYRLASEFGVRSNLPQSTLDAELRAAIRRTAPGMAEMSMQSMEESIGSSLRERRLALRLVSSFGAVALLLAAIGIYGVLSYTVTQRRREIGIRMALGSSRSGATKLVVRQAGMMVLLGLAIGCAAAWPVGRAVHSFLFGVGALDPWAFSATAAMLLLVSVIAATAPAWRAARVNPMEVLRSE
jgi:putative ABC transport system permease protein